MPVYRRKWKDRKTNKIRYGHYYYKFSINGVTYKKTVKEARTRPQAELVETKVRQEIFDGTYDVKRPMLFEKFVREVYLPFSEQTHKKPEDVKHSANRLIEYFGEKNLAQISPMMIEGYKQTRAKFVTKRKTLLKPGSINTELITLSGILTMAVTNGLLKKNPCEEVSKLETDATPIRRLTDDEEKIMVSFDEPPCLGNLVQIAIWTGFRLGELTALKKDKVNFTRNRIFVVNPKWKKDPRKTVGFPMSGALRDLMLQLCNEGKSEYVFPHPQGGRLNRYDVDYYFRKACHANGIYGFNFHKLRHEFGSRLGDDDVQQKKIAELMGHSSTKQTDIYVHPAEEELYKAAEVASRRGSTRIVPHALKKVVDGKG